MVGKYAAACNGDLFAGVLLDRMNYLYDHSKLVVEGVRWYVRSREDLMKDTGLSRRYYDRAMKVLTDLGYIETRYLPSLKQGAQNALRTTAFRVTEKAKAAIISPPSAVPEPENVPTGGYDVVPTSGYNDVPTGGYTVVPTIKKKLIIEAQKEAKNTALPQQGAAGPLTASGVERVFREALKAKDPSYFHVAWSMKNQALAKQLVKKFGKDTAAVLNGCIASWDDYRDLIRESTNARIPSAPNLLTILGYPSEAMKIAHRKKQAPIKSKVDFGVLFGTK